jgi:hypothetical protein
VFLPFSQNLIGAHSRAQHGVTGVPGIRRTVIGERPGQMGVRLPMIQRRSELLQRDGDVVSPKRSTNARCRWRDTRSPLIYAPSRASLNNSGESGGG